MTGAATRPLTAGETALVASLFGGAVDPGGVEIRRRRWWWFQPRDVVMAPRGHIHIHPEGTGWSADFSREEPGLRGLFVHEMTHVWQHQRGVCLPIARHPFCRYAYEWREGWPLTRYGIEQQAEIVRDADRLRQGLAVPGKPGRAAYDRLLAEAFGGR